MTIDQLINIATVLASSSVAIIISIYSLKKSAEIQLSLKEIEREKDERMQRNALEQDVMLKSIEILQQSFHYLRQVNVACTFIDDPEEKQKRFKLIHEATEYWEKNYCLLPKSIREKFVLVTNLAASCQQPDLHKQGVNMRAGDEISVMFDEIKVLTNEIVDSFNPLSQAIGHERSVAL